MPASEGNIFIDGEVANPKKHNISFVFQEPTCMPWRTVRDNVAYGMEVKHFPKDKIKQRVDYMLDLVGLTDTQTSTPTRSPPAWCSASPSPGPLPWTPTCC